MNSPNDHDALFARMCDGLATDAETAEFHRLLCTDPAALDAWIRYSTLHADLATAYLQNEGLAGVVAFPTESDPSLGTRSLLVAEIVPLD